MADGAQTIGVGQIAGAICAVMDAVKRVPKNGHNKFHGYKYATEADLQTVIRPAMAEAGLVLLPSQTEASEPDECGNVRVRVEYTLAHKSGEIWPEKLVSYGVGNDRAKNGNDGDKAIYKAATGANKYLLFKLFQVDTGDDPEAETVSMEERPRRERSAPPPASERMTKAKSRDLFNDLVNSLRETESRTEQTAWFTGNKARIKTLHEDFEALLNEEMREHAAKHDAAKTGKGDQAAEEMKL